MKNTLLDEVIDRPQRMRLDTVEAVSDRCPVLVSRSAIRALQDDAITFLFHSYQVALFDTPFELFEAKAARVTYALLSTSVGCLS